MALPQRLPPDYTLSETRCRRSPVLRRGPCGFRSRTDRALPPGRPPTRTRRRRASPPTAGSRHPATPAIPRDRTGIASTPPHRSGTRETGCRHRDQAPRHPALLPGRGLYGSGVHRRCRAPRRGRRDPPSRQPVAAPCSSHRGARLRDRRSGPPSGSRIRARRSSVGPAAPAGSRCRGRAPARARRRAVSRAPGRTPGPIAGAGHR